MKKKLSVIIVAYKKRDILEKCIESIFNYNDIGNDLEVIVVDNSPDTKCIYDYMKNKYKNIIIIKNINNGFGGGNNVGARVAQGEYLLFLNPDTILIESVFKFAIRKFGKNSNLALFGVKLVSEELRHNLSYYFRVKHYRFIYKLLIKPLNRFNVFIPSKMYIAGANIFIRKNIFCEIGMFDENIFMYYEEPDIIERIEKLDRKYTISFFPEKKIIHLEGKTTDVKSNGERIRLESLNYYCQKHYLNFKKILNSQFKYLRLKIFILKIFNKGNSNLVELSEIYKKYI